MNSLAASTTPRYTESSRTLRAQLVSDFQKLQNADGGWPFHQAGESRVEPTCWALRALADSSDFAQSNITRGLDFLKSQQLSDGSWPATHGMESGGWMTSLVCGVLAQFPSIEEFLHPTADVGAPGSSLEPGSSLSQSSIEKQIHAGLQWLCDDFPRDSSRWQKFLSHFQSNKHAEHNDEFRGWGWTPRTASWVEPTAFALMALASVSEVFSSDSSVAPGPHPKSGLRSELPKSLAHKLEQRRSLAIGLLYDRMCAGGGWNCGNPRVYGVDGDSLVLPTCWALLALRKAAEHPNRALSLTWLQKSFATIASPGSLAIAQITLETYGIPIPAASHNLSDCSAADLAKQGTHIAAWAALALNPARAWFAQSQPKAAAGPPQ